MGYDGLIMWFMFPPNKTSFSYVIFGDISSNLQLPFKICVYHRVPTLFVSRYHVVYICGDISHYLVVSVQMRAVLRYYKGYKYAIPMETYTLIYPGLWL
jgi:hypothetical protein